MKSLTIIEVTNIPHPLFGVAKKHYYELIRDSQHGMMFVKTVFKEDGEIDSISRCLMNSKVKNMKLNNLKSKFACSEICRCISDMFNVPYVSKKRLREDILKDARYIIPPYRCKFVYENDEIGTGTIVGVYYDKDLETNVCDVITDTPGKKSVLLHLQGGQVNIPFQNWRNLSV